MSAEYEEFESLVANGIKEYPLQKFLADHPKIIQDTFNAGSQFPTVFPQFSLAGEYIPDFVMIGHRSSWMWNVDLIEIEPSVLDKRLFNKADQAAGRLRDAESQINKWKIWMDEYQNTVFIPKALKELRKVGAWDKRPEFYNSLEGIQPIYVRYRIIIGRRKDFKGWGNMYRKMRFREDVEIVPWDRLLEKFKSRLEISYKTKLDPRV